MNPETKQLILQAYQNAPRDIQGVITSARFDPAVQEIGKKYRLHIDQGARLHNEVAMLILGITRPNDFVGNIAREIGTPDDTARGIAADVNEQIFKQIKESLKKLHEVTADRETRNENRKPVGETVSGNPESTTQNQQQEEMTSAESSPQQKEQIKNAGETVDIVTQKLSAPVTAPMKETIAKPIDPYREMPE